MSEEEKQSSQPAEDSKQEVKAEVQAEQGADAQKDAKAQEVQGSEQKAEEAKPAEQKADAKVTTAQETTAPESAAPEAKASDEADAKVGKKPEPEADKQSKPETPEGASDAAKAAPEVKKPVAPAKPAAAAKPAAKPKKEAPPPDPRVVEAEKTADSIKGLLVEKFGADAVVETGAAHRTPMVLIEKSYWLKAVDYLRTHQDWQLNYVECMAGTDYPDYLETLIYVQSTKLGHFICLKTRTDREQAEMPSLVPIYPGVNWEEREIYDLLGVNFTGHPDLRRIMMWDGFEGHPLRKDYSEWD